ncbi:MAG: insulinase family protein [Alphaproteobacteria bacterium]|nr:insulinase family protein [Alphaproteobacteria bacterium]MDX5369362.1 insulinase family protein [Alphaproteobacteria bacterium]MDX5464043.1 insulinase family protein [Alphaproteobacteria bacterium]
MSVEITQLPNGLTVVTDPMPSLASAALGVWVEVGARHERGDEHGLSHMLEHMAFKGTARRSARAIAEEIEAVGGHLNAYTSRDQTAYHARVLAGDVPLGVDILADILRNSTFAPVELERERAVILQEIGEVEDTPDDLIFDLLQEIAYPDQAAGRPILGTRDSVGGLTRDAIRDFLARHYGAAAMTLVASGKVAHAEIVALAEDAFGDMAAGARPQGAPLRFAGGEVRRRRKLEQAHIALGLDGVGYGDPDYFTSQVFSVVYGGGMSSRLFQSVREERGLAYTVFSFASSLADGGMVGVYAGTGASEAAHLLAVVVDELEKLAGDATEEEVARARAQIKAGLLMSYESPAVRAEQIARQLSVWGRVMDVDEVAAAIDAVDAAAVRRFAARLMHGGPPALAALGPVQSLEKYATLKKRFG